MYVKIHYTENSIITAICDENLIGKKVESKTLQLNISKTFYKGEKKSEKEVIEIMKQATCLNLIGKKTIGLALKLKLISKENIIKVKGVPHAQCLAM